MTAENRLVFREVIDGPIPIEDPASCPDDAEEPPIVVVPGKKSPIPAP